MINAINFTWNRTRTTRIWLITIAVLGTLAASAALADSSPKANKTILLDLDLQRLARPGAGNLGNVVIEHVTDARNISPVGNSQVTDPALLVGQYLRSSTSTYDVVLTGGKDVTDLARETMEIALTRAGYTVIQPGSEGAVDAAAIDLRVDRFWVEYDPEGGSNRRSFDCEFDIAIDSAAEPFSRIVSVSGSGFRNGSRPRNPKSYSNSLLHSLKFLLEDFEIRHNSVMTSVADPAADANDDRVLRIRQAHELLDTGAITEEEYEELKDRILAE